MRLFKQFDYFNRCAQSRYGQLAGYHHKSLSWKVRGWICELTVFQPVQRKQKTICRYVAHEKTPIARLAPSLRSSHQKLTRKKLLGYTSIDFDYAATFVRYLLPIPRGKYGGGARQRRARRLRLSRSLPTISRSPTIVHCAYCRIVIPHFCVQKIPTV
ncbi:hypothetical protein EVAR_63951_1 [Eumeta japonica]|uniref:Uncharacterized protein n=1 Tax=Eumeta variegata TaxID=151549 RepID=A0A4C2A0E1_EUMVA|nr:hypothetical protein EVAR_63951_1 [Eumeta japonica]